MRPSKLLRNYLRFWAKIYLQRAQPQIVAVTGSAGKTSAKEAIFAVLKIRFGKKVRKSYGNLNTQNGVGLAVLGFKKSPAIFYQWLWPLISSPLMAYLGKKVKFLVLEIAADKPGDIGFITSFIKPDIVVLTNIGPAHLEIFGSMENLIKEKMTLLEALKSDGWVVLNVDDKELKKLKNNLKNIKTFAIYESADVMAKNIQTKIINFQPKTDLTIKTSVDEFSLFLNTLGGVGNVYAALAAVSCGEIFKIDQKDMTKGLLEIQSEKHRLQVFEGKNKSVLIDDAYNANPLSMKVALDVLRKTEGSRKIAVLGDMLELGTIKEEAHQLIGKYAAESADEVLAIGPLAKLYGAKKHFEKQAEVIAYLLGEIQKGDIILIKASRGMGLEKIVEALKAD